MLEQFENMYNNAWDISTLFNKNTEEFAAFSTKRGLPVKVYQLPNLIEHVPIVKEYYKFIREANCMYVIPCDDFKGNILGYVLRAVSQKSYTTVFADDTIQPSFGWYDFGDYQRGMPIIITEGIKDCLYVKQFYKYTISTLSCKVSNDFLELLSNLTDNVITAFDNDIGGRTNPGQSAAKRVAKGLSAFGVSCKNIIPQEGLKDFGEYFNKGLDTKARLMLKMFISNKRPQ